MSPLQVKCVLFSGQRTAENKLGVDFITRLACLDFYGQEEIDDCKNRINIPMF